MRFSQLLLVLLLAVSVFSAHAFDLVENKHYIVLPKPAVQNRFAKILLEQDKNKAQVLEFFSYGCPACFFISEKVASFAAQADKNKIAFHYVPVIYHKEWQLLAKALYTAQALKVTKKTHPLIFKAIHVDNKSITSASELTPFFRQAGINDDKFMQYFNSFSIHQALQQSLQLTRAYEVSKIPTFVINGQYKTDLSMAGTPEALIEIVNALIKKS